MHEIWPYILIVLGTFLEGEMALISATIAGHQGLVNLPIAISCAVFGTFVADITHFFIGRKGGRKRIENNPKWKTKADNLERRLLQAPFLVLLGIRFLYGFRILAPIIIGITGMNVRKFILYSLITISIWTTVYVSIGYLFGEIIQTYLSEIQHSEKYIIGGVVAIGLVFYLFRRKRAKSLKKVEL